jgi:diacylglycerol O-acyltransferase / wax synthase
MALMSPTDSMFLVGESREQPMHVGSLQVFELPDGADSSLLRSTLADLLQQDEVAPLFRRRPYRSLSTLGQWAWTDDEDVDLEHHVRHSALPQPGRVRELLALVSRLHSTLLDRQRPLWEVHLIEGLEGNRFAVYSKLHHAVMDGVSGMRLLQRALSKTPDADEPAFWTLRPRRSSGGESSSAESAERKPRRNPLLALPKATIDAVADMVALSPRMLRLAEQALRAQAATLPGQAPRSMLNVQITGSRRYAAQSYSMERMRLVAKGAGVTLNDVLLAMSAGALRSYLLERNALPGTPLVAMTPVSLRAESDGDEAAGNAVGAILASLATNEADPEKRLARVAESTQRAKGVLRGLSQLQATALSAGVMLPMAINSLTGMYRFGTLPFNVVISNVPGPRESLYLHGARLSGLYPLSIPVNGQAMNITATSYAEDMGIGLTACRRSVPSVQRMLTGLETSLDELVEVVT